MWFALWTVLVVGTLVGAFVLGRSLWRSGRELLRELGRAADVLGAMADRAAELEADVGRLTAPAPVTFDADVARARRDDLAPQNAARRAARAERHEAVHRRWLSFSR